MTIEQARQCAVAFLKERHARNDKLNRDRLTQRFLNGYPSCQKFLERQQKKSQELEAETSPTEYTSVYMRPDQPRISAPLFSLGEQLELLKDPKLFTLVVTWFGLPFTSFSHALTMLGLRSICPNKSTYYRKIDEIQPVASQFVDVSMEHAIDAITQPTILGFDGGWNHPRNARQGHGVFIDLRTQKVVALGMDWLLVGNETDKLAERCANTCSHLQVYEGFPQSIESHIFKRLYPRFHNNTYILGFAQDNEHDHAGIMKKMSSTKQRFVDVNHNAKHFKNYLSRMLGKSLSRLQSILSRWMDFLLHTTSLREGIKEQLWRNTTSHLLGNHDDCIHGPEKRNGALITEEEALALKPIIEKGVGFLSRSHPLVTTQMNESLNSLRARLTPKNYSWKKAWPLRTTIAVLKWNEGNGALLELCRMLSIPVTVDMLNLVENLSRDCETRSDKSKDPEVRKKRNERRRLTANSLRKGPKGTTDTGTQQSVEINEAGFEEEEFTGDAPQSVEIDEHWFEEDFVGDMKESDEDDDGDVHFSSSTSFESCGSDSPIAKDISNYADIRVEEEQLPLLVRRDCTVFEPKYSLGYTGIINEAQTCYFNTLIQILCVALRSSIRTQRLSIQDITHKSEIPESYQEPDEQESPAYHMEIRILSNWNSDAWGSDLMDVMKRLIIASENVIVIDHIIDTMSKCIRNPDFVYGQQGDPVFVIEYLTRYFDYQLCPGYPKDSYGPFEFHFTILTYKDVITPVTLSKSVAPPEDNEGLIFVQRTCYHCHIPVTLADWAYDIQAMINNELVTIVEDAHNGQVYLRHYLQEKSQHLFVSINRRNFRQLNGEASYFIDHRAIEINHHISVLGGECDGVDGPGGALIYELRGIICHLGADGLGHYVVYVVEEDRVIMINDALVEMVQSDSLELIKKRCVLLLYTFEYSIAQDDLKGRDMFVKTDYLSANDFGGETKNDQIVEEDMPDREAAEILITARRNPPRKCRFTAGP